MELRADLILMILYAPGGSGKFSESISGITRLTKLLFLLEKETDVPNNFNFVPYKMGPFTDEINPVIEFLRTFPSPDKPLVLIENEDNNKNPGVDPEQSYYVDNLVSSDDSAQQLANQVARVFYLSDLGNKVAKDVWEGQSPETRESIISIKKKYGSMSLRQLLKYVYTKYPDMTDKSEIKGWVFER